MLDISGKGAYTKFLSINRTGTFLIYSITFAYCMLQVNTLWGSFEINNVKLLKTMIRQYSQ